MGTTSGMAQCTGENPSSGHGATGLGELIIRQPPGSGEKVTLENGNYHGPRTYTDFSLGSGWSVVALGSTFTGASGSSGSLTVDSTGAGSIRATLVDPINGTLTITGRGALILSWRRRPRRLPQPRRRRLI